MPRDGLPYGSVSDDTSTSISRRRLLELGAAGAVTGVAGCMGGESSDGGDQNTLTLPALRGDALHDLNFNQMHPTTEVRYMQGFIWAPVANWSSPEEEWQPAVASDWSFPDEIEAGTEATITIADELYWHNGDPVTADDAVNDLTLRRLDDPGAFAFLDDWEVVDEKTFGLTFGEAYNRELVLQELFNNYNFDLEFGSPSFREHHEALEEATTDQEREDVLVNVTEMHLDEPVGNGPFAFEEASTNYVLFEKVDDYPLADFNFDYIRVEEVADTYRSAVAEQDIDRAINESFFYEDDVQYSGAEIREYPANKGFGLCFDTRQEELYFNNRRVRQALAWAINRHDIAMDLAPQGVSNRDEIAEKLYVETVTGMNDNAIEYYLGDWSENLPDYDGRESNFERATEILEEEGFYMEDDWWHTPDGERWQFEIINYGEWEWQAVPQSIVGQLRSFGIDMEQRTIESGEYWSTAYAEDEYETRLSVWGADSPQSPLPAPLAWDQQVREVASMSRTLQRQNDVVDFEWEMDLYYEAPMPVGDPDGSIEEVNVGERLRELYATSDPDRIEELVREVTWVKSHYLDSIPVYAFLRNGLYNTEHWEWADEGGDLDNLFNNQLYTDIPLGSVNARTE